MPGKFDVRMCTRENRRIVVVVVVVSDKNSAADIYNPHTKLSIPFVEREGRECGSGVVFWEGRLRTPGQA